MDPLKRKRTSDDVSNGGDRRKPRGANGDEKREDGDRDHCTAVNDADVEEFYAILQRVQATRCLVVRKTEAERLRWKPRFVWEDFEAGDTAVKDDGGGEAVSGEDKEREEAVRVKGGLELDLNADPEPEGGECPARCAGVEA